ncbi:MAG: signal peptide peptidase SppA [Planctomycetota bacterium]
MCSQAWALDSQHVEIMNTIVTRHASGEKLDAEEIAEIVAARRAKEGDDGMPSYSVEDGVAVVPIHGVISRYASQVNNISGPSGTSVEQVREHVVEALGDDRVKAILLDIDSPGGSTDGLAELADDLRAANDMKPLFSFTEGLAASAAYWLGSQSREFIASKGARVGSIGVYRTLIDSSEAAKARGLRVDVVKAGEHKAMGEPGTQIGAKERAEAQRLVNSFYEMFIDGVAKGRGISIKAATALGDGRVHLGQQAKEIGLVDQIGSAKDARALVLARISSERAQSSMEADGINVDGRKDTAMPEPATSNTSNSVANSVGSPGYVGPFTCDPPPWVGSTDLTVGTGTYAGVSHINELADVTAASSADAATLLKAAHPHQMDLVAKLISDGSTTEQALVALAQDAKEHYSVAIENAAKGAAQAERDKLIDENANESLGAAPDVQEGAGRPTTPEEAFARVDVQEAFFSLSAVKGAWAHAEEEKLDPWAFIQDEMSE